MPLFDEFVIVDWSAAATPRRGRDSIWIARITADGAREEPPVNLPTRAAAAAFLDDLLAAAAGRRLLVGFDFSLGYPRGFAAALDLPGPRWRAVWDLLAREIADDDANRNNRFAVAASLNRRLSGGAAPFWGCPVAAASAFLRPTRPSACALRTLEFATRRVCETVRPSLQPVWKLFTAGSVGSQALTGIPRVRALRDAARLSTITRVWPFETGLQVPLPAARIVLAEIYPSLVDSTPVDHPIKDARQVIALARHFAALDRADRLGACFELPGLVGAAARAAVEGEEGWVLGLGGRA